jgi:hypothetical protein
MDYGKSFYSGEDFIVADYTEPSFYNGKIALRKETKNLLFVLTGEDKYAGNVLRYFARNCLTSDLEGRNWQTALSLYGAAGTAKSAWAELIKKLVSPHYVQEFSREQNQFTANQLAFCKVLIVSDLSYLSGKQKDVFKRLLGRDTFAKEDKFDPHIGMISPACQVLIISNSPPEQFELFKNDSALLDKLIRVRFPSSMVISSEHQTPNTANYLDGYMADVVNWCMYSPKEFLQYFIRAKDLTNYFNRREGRQKGAISGWLEDCCLHAQKGVLASLDDVKISIFHYLEETGEDQSFLDNIKKDQLIFLISGISENTFGVTLRYGRQTTAGKRPYGIFNFTCTDGREVVSDEVQTGRFKPIQTAIITLPYTGGSLKVTLGEWGTSCMLTPSQAYRSG